MKVGVLTFQLRRRQRKEGALRWWDGVVLQMNEKEVQKSVRSVLSCRDFGRSTPIDRQTIKEAHQLAAHNVKKIGGGGGG